MLNKRHIAKIVDSGLCTSCGTCVAICPENAIKMAETLKGLLLAKVNDDKCISCGLCLRVCGGSHLEPGLIAPQVDPFKGKVLKAYCGYATNENYRRKGQSGGVVTALLNFLLETSRSHRALVAHMPQHGKLRPEPVFVSGGGELGKVQGSLYCPVALNTAFDCLKEEKGKKIVTVGLPCHLHGIRNAQCHDDLWRSNIDLTIGLFCDRTLSFAAIDCLVEKAGAKMSEVETFRYRDKSDDGWPGSVYMKCWDNQDFRVANRERQLIKERFTPLRCRVCFDKMNILSDISVGDAWGVVESREGHSSVLARTQKGLNLLESATGAGVLVLEQVDAERVFVGQAIEKRREQCASFAAIFRRENQALPDAVAFDDPKRKSPLTQLKFRKKFKLSRKLNTALNNIS